MFPSPAVAYLTRNISVELRQPCRKYKITQASREKQVHVVELSKIWVGQKIWLIKKKQSFNIQVLKARGLTGRKDLSTHSLYDTSCTWCMIWQRLGGLESSLPIGIRINTLKCYRTEAQPSQEKCIFFQIFSSMASHACDIRNLSVHVHQHTSCFYIANTEASCHFPLSREWLKTICKQFAVCFTVFENIFCFALCITISISVLVQNGAPCTWSLTFRN